MKSGSHLRVQQDPAEYQKPLKIFQIAAQDSSASEQGEGDVMSIGDKSVDQSWPPRPTLPQVEDDVPQTPPGLVPPQEEDEMDGMPTGLMPPQEEGNIIESPPGPDQMQYNRNSAQPAGWTNEMTIFVEGSLCGGNDVKTTANLLRLEHTEAFDVLGLEEQIEKLKNEYLNKKGGRVEGDQVPRAPLGWTDKMTDAVHSFLRHGERIVDLMVQDLEVVDDDTLGLEGVHEYVAKLKLDFESQEQDQTDQD